MKHEPTGTEWRKLIIAGTETWEQRGTWIDDVVKTVIRHWESIRPSDQQTASDRIDDLLGKLKEAQAEIDQLKGILPEWIPVTEKLDHYVIALAPDSGDVANFCNLEPAEYKRFTHYIEKFTLANLPKREPVKAADPEAAHHLNPAYQEYLAAMLAKWPEFDSAGPSGDLSWEVWKAARKGGSAK